MFFWAKCILVIQEKSSENFYQQAKDLWKATRKPNSLKLGAPRTLNNQNSWELCYYQWIHPVLTCTLMYIQIQISLCLTGLLCQTGPPNSMKWSYYNTWLQHACIGMFAWGTWMRIINKNFRTFYLPFHLQGLDKRIWTCKFPWGDYYFNLIDGD